MKRKGFLQRLRKLIKKYGSDNVVYFDESGFKLYEGRSCGLGLLRGTKIYGDVRGKRQKQTHFLMVQRGKK